MHYEISYKSIEDRVERDNRAIADALDYVGEDKFNLLIELASLIEMGHSPFGHLNFGMSMAGVSGYPFHAFARRYCLKAYREWMASGDDAVQTDEAGYSMEKN